MASFDIQKVIEASGLPADLIEEVLREAEADYPDRGALYELRVLRSLHGELRSRVGPEAWQSEMRERVRKMLEEHGYELEPVALSDDELAQVVKRRMDEVAEGKVRLVPWADVRARLQRRTEPPGAP